MAKKVNLLVELTFNAETCLDVDSDGYDASVDLHSICEYGVDYFNLNDWKVIQETRTDSDNG